MTCTRGSVLSRAELDPGLRRRVRLLRPGRLRPRGPVGQLPAGGGAQLRPGERRARPVGARAGRGDLGRLRDRVHRPVARARSTPGSTATACWRATWPRCRADAAVFAAAKATRRIIGFARVSDIETLPEPERADGHQGRPAGGASPADHRARSGPVRPRGRPSSCT